ncbi:MAG: hypothetical protein ACLQG3_00025 [Terracidiphilus sp.]
MNVVRRSAGLFLFVAMLICGCDLSPGSEFTGKWVNAKDPTETVEIVPLTFTGTIDENKGTWFKIKYGNGTATNAYLGSGCSCILEIVVNAGNGSQEWQYDKNSDTLVFLPGISRFEKTYKRTK